MISDATVTIWRAVLLSISDYFPPECIECLLVNHYSLSTLLQLGQEGEGHQQFGQCGLHVIECILLDLIFRK